ncbi:hypothetical protein TM1040_2048 [Ruegeria sp. TM1040]|nr:hypothetical protein TM1040_2048 [Ruegeria sp. TM1040]
MAGLISETAEFARALSLGALSTRNDAPANARKKWSAGTVSCVIMREVELGDWGRIMRASSYGGTQAHPLPFPIYTEVIQ